MLRRRPGVLAALAGLAVALLVVPAAPAAQLPSDVRAVVRDFQADGTISPCEHTVAALERTSRMSADAVGEESPDFLPAVEAALEARKQRDCGAGKGGASASAAEASATPTPTRTAGPATAAPAATASPSATPRATPTATPTLTATPTPQPTPTPTATVAPTPVATPTPVLASSAQGHDAFPLGLWILAGLLALAALAWIVLAVLGRLGWGEERLASPRHAWAEARYRAGGVWSDFSDWLRLGR